MGKRHSESSHNPTAKSIARWENEGGAPKRPKRSRDPKQLAKAIIDVATGGKREPRRKATPASKKMTKPRQR